MEIKMVLALKVRKLFIHVLADVGLSVSVLSDVRMLLGFACLN